MDIHGDENDFLSNFLYLKTPEEFISKVLERFLYIRKGVGEG